jgi:hypothetical protein
MEPEEPNKRLGLHKTAQWPRGTRDGTVRVTPAGWVILILAVLGILTVIGGLYAFRMLNEVAGVQQELRRTR